MGFEDRKDGTRNLALQSLRTCKGLALHYSRAVQRSKHFSMAAHDNVGRLLIHWREQCNMLRTYISATIPYFTYR